MNIKDLKQIIKSNIEVNKTDLELIEKAFYFAKQKFGKNENITGVQTLIEHALNTAKILAEMKTNVTIITAGLLHDIKKYSKNVTSEEIAKSFNKEVANIIDSITEIDEIKFKEKSHGNDNIQKMILAIAKDIRVIVVKLAEVLDISRHLKSIKSSKKRLGLARKIIEIYAPLAGLLGMWRVRWQLEDNSFQYLMPAEYKKIEKTFGQEKKKEREKYIKKIQKILKGEAQRNGIKCDISGRFKHFYSIYKKMHERGVKFNEIYDVFALRVIVKDIPTCYQMLGIIHRLWKPKPQRIKDYIATPKPNGYQSIHTTVFGLEGKMTEFQIRTPEMHEEALYGIASHWLYKNKKYGNLPYLQKGLGLIENIIHPQKNILSRLEQENLTENLKIDLFEDRIFVFTPKGDIIDLPKDSTPVDFAYFVHTDVGNKCYKAIVNDRKVDLDTKLKNNDVIEIVTDAKQGGPKPDWLNFAKSNLAKSKIKEYIKKKKKS